jgi:hypothetical protein
MGRMAIKHVAKWKNMIVYEMLTLYASNFAGKMLIV